jgi:hypothetical protein
VRLARHRRRQKVLRRQRRTARRIGDCDKHCEYNDAQPDRFAHGRRGRDVRYARTIANAHHVSQALMQSPCARLVRIMSPIILLRRYARSARRTLRLHDRQRASLKLSVHAAALSSPCANHAIILPRRYAQSPRRTLRLHDRQRASRKLCVHAAALSSPCVNHAPPH